MEESVEALLVGPCDGYTVHAGITRLVGRSDVVGTAVLTQTEQEVIVITVYLV